MTPRPAQVQYYPHEVATPPRADSLKADVVKYLISAIVAALTAYFATIYGIREEVAVLKVRLEYLKERVDAQTVAIERLTNAVNAHTLEHRKEESRR